VRATLGFDEISYGVGGIYLLPPEEVSSGQIGYAVDAHGSSLIGNGAGEWRDEWIVIGQETACGDPLFISVDPPYPVFWAMHGQGAWAAKFVAPSLERFWSCLELFREFANARENSVQLAANAPSKEEIEAYLSSVRHLCDEDEDAFDFWLIQAEIGMNEDSE